MPAKEASELVYCLGEDLIIMSEGMNDGDQN